MLDLLIVLYFIYQLVLGWHRGFVNMLLRLIVGLMSLFVCYRIFKHFTLFFLHDLANMIFILLLFLLIKSLLIFIINKCTKLLHKIPVIGTINRIFGSVLGILSALMILFVFISLLKLFAPMSMEIQTLLTQSFLLRQ